MAIARTLKPNFAAYIKAQIEIVQPKVIVALGNTAVTGLLGHDPKRKLGQVRGHWHEFEGTPMMISFHPSYLLRNDTMRPSAWLGKTCSK